jgi:hypothetical protein
MTKIKDYLQKPVWTRRAPGTVLPRIESGSSLDTQEMTFDVGTVYKLNQSDFLNELSPTAHKINSCTYRSMRQKFRYDAATQANVADGWDEVERVAVGFQEGVLRHKVTHTFGNEMWFGPEGKDPKNDERVSVMRSHWSMAGMTDALNSWGRALFGTGDAAIYLSEENGVIQYKVFSYEKGDVFCMSKNDDNQDVFVRMLKVAGVTTVEIYGPTHIDVWVEKDPTGKFQEFVDKAFKILKGKKNGESEDGFIQVEHRAHGLSQCPVMYFRIQDVVWGKGQDIIERIERILSDLGENNKYFAYQILFIAGGVLNLPPVGQMGKTIAAKSVDAKAEILQPADASNTFTIDLEKNLDLLWETLGVVVIEPKELKAGENTGAFIRNLYWREVQWSTNMIAELRPAFMRLISIFKELVAKAENDRGFEKIKMTYLLEPYVPKNITEEITNICMASNAGITSRETAAGEIPFNNPMEIERLKKEDEEAVKKEAEEELTKETSPVVTEPGNEGEGANNQAKK